MNATLLTDKYENEKSIYVYPNKMCERRYSNEGITLVDYGKTDRVRPHG